MTKKELLTTYRTRVIELEELRHQLARVGTDGRPAGCRTMRTDRIIGGTNDPSAAAMHLADGLESLAQRLQQELDALAPEVHKLLLDIRDMKTYLVIQHYYVFAQSDEEIGSLLALSRTRVGQIRRDCFNAL